MWCKDVQVELFVIKQVMTEFSKVTLPSPHGNMHDLAIDCTNISTVISASDIIVVGGGRFFFKPKSYEIKKWDNKSSYEF